MKRPEFHKLRLNLGHFGNMFAMAESLPPEERKLLDQVSERPQPRKFA